MKRSKTGPWFEGTRMHVVLVHGWQMTGWEMALLGRRLAQAGHSVERFRYRSRHESPAMAGERLACRLCEALPVGAPLGLIAHSLGGHVVRHALATTVLPAGSRVVFLGSPLAGSAAARHLVTRRWGRRWLGAAWVGGLDGRSPPVPGLAALAVRGTRRGAGVLLARGLTRPHDGTVSAVETEGPEVAQRRSFACTHFGLLLSRDVAHAVRAFLDGDTRPE